MECHNYGSLVGSSDVATTTMASISEASYGERTVAPARRDAAKLVAIRVFNAPGRFIAWSPPAEQPLSGRITTPYILAIEIDEGLAGCVGDAAEVASESWPTTRSLIHLFSTTMAASRAEFTPRTPLGERLWQLRKRIVASGERLLDWDELAQEVRARRGERDTGGPS